MDNSFIRERITELRLKKGVSEYKMSTDLGHSKGYIQSITSGRALPSLNEFMYMCHYLGVSPKDFFYENVTEAPLVRQLWIIAQQMSEEDLRLLISIAKRLNVKPEAKIESDSQKISV